MAPLSPKSPATGVLATRMARQFRRCIGRHSSTRHRSPHHRAAVLRGGAPDKNIWGIPKPAKAKAALVGASAARLASHRAVWLVLVFPSVFVLMRFLIVIIAAIGNVAIPRFETAPGEVQAAMHFVLVARKHVIADDGPGLQVAAAMEAAG